LATVFLLLEHGTSTGVSTVFVTPTFRWGAPWQPAGSVTLVKTAYVDITPRLLLSVSEGQGRIAALSKSFSRQVDMDTEPLPWQCHAASATLVRAARLRAAATLVAACCLGSQARASPRGNLQEEILPLWQSAL